MVALNLAAKSNHRLRERIEAHICIAFTAYCIYKDLERALYQAKSTLSLKKAAEITHNMYQITYTLPESKHTESHLLRWIKSSRNYTILSRIIFKVLHCGKQEKASEKTPV